MHSIEPIARQRRIPFSIDAMPSAVSPETLRAQPMIRKGQACRSAVEAKVGLVHHFMLALFAAT
jgi:hypothetical protein